MSVYQDRRNAKAGKKNDRFYNCVYEGISKSIQQIIILIWLMELVEEFQTHLTITGNMVVM